MLRVTPHCRGLGQRLLSHRFLTPLGYHHVCPEPCQHPHGQVAIGGHDKNLEYMKKKKKRKRRKKQRSITNQALCNKCRDPFATQPKPPAFFAPPLLS